MGAFNGVTIIYVEGDYFIIILNFKGVTIIYVGGFQNDQMKILSWGSDHLL